MNGEEDLKKNKRINGKRVLKAVRSLQKFLSKSSKPRGRPPKGFRKSNIGRGMDLAQIEEFWKRKWGEEGLDTIQSSLDEEVKNGKLVMYNSKYCLKLHNNNNPSPNNGNDDEDEEDEELLIKGLNETMKKEENSTGDTSTSEDKEQMFSISPKVETKLSNGKQEEDCVPVVVVVRRDVDNKKMDSSDKKKRKFGTESNKSINTVTLIKKFKLENKDDVKLIITSDKNTKSTNKTDSTYNSSDPKDTPKMGKICESCSTSDQNEQLLTCKFCQICYHPTCLGYSRDLSLRALSQAWECANCKTCVVCRGSEEEKMLICDSCDRGYHMQCHQPPINHSFDNEDWICSSCKGKKESLIKRSISIIVSSPNNTSHLNNNTSTHPNNVVATNHNNLTTQQHNITTHVDNTKKAFDDRKLDDEDGTQSDEMSPTGPHTTLPRVLFTTDTDVGGASDWSVQQVHDYFVKAGYSEQADTFVKEEIDGKALLLLLRQDIVAGMNFKLGPALKINAHVDRIKKANNHNNPDVITGQ